MLRSQRRGRDPPCWLSEKEPLVGKRRVNFQRCWLPVSRIGLHRRGVERVNCGPKLLDLGEKGVYSSYTSLSIHPMGDTGKYRLWILRYGEHYLIIEIGYDKLRESIREHQFQLAFNKGIPYETLSRRSYG